MAKAMTPQERARYEALVSEFRRLVNGVPRWEIREGPNGQSQVVDSTFGQPVFQPCGVWEQNLLRYFAHVRHDSLMKLLGLLDGASGPDTRRLAMDFLESLRLLPPPASGSTRADYIATGGDPVATFRPDHRGIAEILKSEHVRVLVREAAHDVAAEVRAQGHHVEDGGLLPVEVRDESDTDRAAASVAIPHASGVGMEARYGLLKRAAAVLGLRAKGISCAAPRPQTEAKAEAAVTGPRVPVPVDVVELVVRLLRRILAEHAGEQVRGAQVATETGRGKDGGPPSLPWLLVAADDHDWQWPAIQTAAIRITCWHHTEHTAKALLSLVMGLLCARPALGAFIAAEPDTAPISGVDPRTSAPLAFIVLTVTARTSTR